MTLTAASLSYVATMSGARNAENVVLKAEKIAEANRRRSDVRADLEKGRADLQAEGDRMAQECRTGKGSRCAGVRETVARLESHVAVLEARLGLLGSPEIANAGYRQAAEAVVLTGLSSRNAADLERALVVLLPWLAVLIAELGTIVFLSSALGHSHSVSDLVPLVPANDPDPNPGSRRDVIDWCRAFQAKHGRRPRIPEVQAVFHTPKTSTWRYIKMAA
jgi:hypothetical protein